ncbi:27147_t:CDS:2 [Gigaspora margarita]|uniref:27147_t:CDS:1 n=1 Tax=Gigaspora margarita TaxID=4874 RepID=A0ABM8VYL7_GIGMA|nr:27147_t:CDS:2 [Gigaspora margarita]
MVKNESDGYFFHPKQPGGIFNTARVLYCIRKFLEQKEELNNSWDSLIRDALLNFPSDTQTFPSQMSLDLIVNNPLGYSVPKDITRVNNLYKEAADGGISDAQYQYACSLYKKKITNL